MRFPEFTGEWEKKQLQEECSFFSGGTPSSSNKEYYDGDIPFIRSGEIDAQHTELFLTQKGYNNSSAKMVEIGDLLLALYGATSGEIAINKIHGAINQAILCIRSPYNNVFVKSIWKKHVLHILQTYLQGGQGNLSADIVKKLSFYFPSNREQDKISEFVALVDQRIETQNKIIQHLESLIKGISKMLLTKRGNTFIKDCLVCNSSTLQESSVLPCGKYPVYGATGISGYLDVPQVEHDAILIIKDGAGVGNVRYATDKHGVIGTLNYLSAKNGYNLKYLYYCLRIFNFTPFVTGLAIPHIYFRDYGNAKIYCPSLIEQKHIANNLSNIERKIEVEKQILEKFKEQKKYLLSQMFI